MREMIGKALVLLVILICLGIVTPAPLDDVQENYAGRGEVEINSQLARARKEVNVVDSCEPFKRMCIPWPKKRKLKQKCTTLKLTTPKCCFEKEGCQDTTTSTLVGIEPAFWIHFY